jgi:hypothetical protein
MAKTKKPNEHYVNNKEFSHKVVEYVKTVREAEESGEPAPPVTDYIADCFMRIARGLSFKSNFVMYTYREEMMMDAVENCLKAINNYNIETATRTGKPNAFSYFTQISWYAFLRRIAKEKRQHEIKMKFMFERGIDEFMISESEDPEASRAVRQYVDQLREKMDNIRDPDSLPPPTQTPSKSGPVTVRNRKRTDSDLSDFYIS